MNPVTKEFVEQTADFIFHLSDKQLEDRIADYKKRQFNLYSIINREASAYQIKYNNETIWQMSFILIRCYEYYQVKLPMISEIFMKETIQNDINKRIVKQPGDPDDLQIKLNIEKTGQLSFFNFIENVILKDKKYQTSFTQKESDNMIFMLMIVGLIYSKSISRYS